MQRIMVWIACALVLAASQLSQVQAGVPLLLSHQGRLLDASDHPVNGNVDITFKIFDSSSDGALLWTEVHPTVAVTNGLFNVQLGSLTPLTSDMLAPPSSGPVVVVVERYLEVQVGASPPLSPRVRLVATPYSVASERVSGDIETTPGQVKLESRSGSTTGTIRMAASSDSTIDALDRDEDGDGVAERRVRLKVRAQDATGEFLADTDDDGVSDNDIQLRANASGALTKLEGRSGSTTGTIRMSASGGGPILPSTELAQEMDSNGNGTAEKYYVMGCTHDRVSALMASDDDDDGVADHDLELSSDATGSVARWGGRSGSTTGTIRMMATADSVTDYRDVDSDNDGIAERAAKLVVTDDAGRISLTADTDDDGVADYSVESSCDATQSSATVAGDVPGGTASVEWHVDAQGPMVIISEPIGDRFLVCPDSGLQLYDDLGAKSCDLDSEGDGYLSSSLKVATTSGTHLIDVGTGGAYCDGTDWVNGSDVASKENFKPVDGEELLNRIANLKITRWNYKGQPKVEHIGPMAQDFQAAFGLGANDKTISTIDPSGIALAAIKELQQQNKLLQEALEKLNRKVEELSSNR